MHHSPSRCYYYGDEIKGKSCLVIRRIGKLIIDCKCLFESLQDNGNMKYIVKMDITGKEWKNMDRFRMVELL